MSKQKRLTTQRLSDIAQEWANKSNNAETKRVLIEMSKRLQQYVYLSRDRRRFEEEKRAYYRERAMLQELIDMADRTGKFSPAEIEKRRI
jgi:K+/H+ antiporter YhaU regulatory subunit KhtT